MGKRTCTHPGCDDPHEAKGYCGKHYQRLRHRGSADDRPQPTVEERFWAKVDASGVCWEWTANTDRYGYGSFMVAAGKCVRAHRYAYELLVGPIPDGLHIDHLCRNTRCLDPDHLEPVTCLVNNRRGASGKRQAARTHCPQGHPYSGDNLYRYPPSKRYPAGRRQCRTCAREAGRRYEQRMAAAKRAA